MEITLNQHTIWRVNEYMDIGPGWHEITCRHCGAKVVNEYESDNLDEEWPKHLVAEEHWQASHKSWCQLASSKWRE